MAQIKQLSASLEDYLEAIFHIISKKGGVRAKDIAAYLDVKAGSVTTALQSLAKTSHINYKPYGIITLTDKGLEQAKEVIRKHEILTNFFVEILGANPEEAEAGACKIEHVITDKLLNRLIAFTEFIQSCPRCGDMMIDKFHGFYDQNNSCEKEQCQTCLKVG